MENQIKPVDPAIVPQRKLSNGMLLPAVGIGTFGSDSISYEDVSIAIKDAIKKGYRHIDCASVYGNEKHIGKVFKEIFEEGIIKREELWITSKVWNNRHDDVIASCKQSVEELQCGYLDVYLTHWPFPNFHAEGVSVDSRDPHAKPYIHEDFMKTWAQMEQCQEMGLTKSIGTSNMTKAKMELLLRDCKIRPVVTEMELHPHYQQTELFNYYMSEGIQPIVFCPIGSPNRPERDKTAEDTVPIQDPVIVEIAKKHGVHPAVICLKWAVQRGQAIIPFSIVPGEYMSNLVVGSQDLLTDEEMAAITATDKNCRFIKGQVFCWVGSEWQDLWDEDGTIKGW